MTFEDWLREKMNPLNRSASGPMPTIAPPRPAPDMAALASVLGIRAPQSAPQQPSQDAMAFMAKMLGGANAPPPNAAQQALLNAIVAPPDPIGQAMERRVSRQHIINDANARGGFTPEDQTMKALEQRVSRQHLINDANTRGGVLPVRPNPATEPMDGLPPLTDEQLFNLQNRSPLVNPAIYDYEQEAPGVVGDVVEAVDKAVTTSLTQNPVDTAKDAGGAFFNSPVYTKPSEVSQSLLGDIMYAAAQGKDLPEHLKGLPFADQFFGGVQRNVNAEPEIAKAITEAGGGNASFDAGAYYGLEDLPALLQFVSVMAIGGLTDPWTYLPVVGAGGTAARGLAETVEAASKARQVARATSLVDDAARAGTTGATAANAANAARIASLADDSIEATRAAQAAASVLRGTGKTLDAANRIVQLPEDVVFRAPGAIVRGTGDVIDAVVPGGERFTGAVRKGADIVTRQTAESIEQLRNQRRRRGLGQYGEGPATDSDTLFRSPDPPDATGGDPTDPGGTPGGGTPGTPTAPLPQRWVRDVKVENTRVIEQLAKDDPDTYRAVYRQIDLRTEEFSQVIDDPNVPAATKIAEEARYARDIERIITNAGGTPTPRRVTAQQGAAPDTLALPNWASSQPIEMPQFAPSTVAARDVAEEAAAQSEMDNLIQAGNDRRDAAAAQAAAQAARDAADAAEEAAAQVELDRQIAEGNARRQPQEVRVVPPRGKNGKYTYVGDSSEYRISKVPSGKYRIDAQNDYGDYKPLGSNPFRATYDEAVEDAKAIVRGDKPLTVNQLTTQPELPKEVPDATVPWEDPTPQPAASQPTVNLEELAAQEELDRLIAETEARRAAAATAAEEAAAQVEIDNLIAERAARQASVAPPSESAGPLNYDDVPSAFDPAGGPRQQRVPSDVGRGGTPDYPLPPTPRTREERDAAIRSRKISVMTPQYGGDRLLDRAYTKSFDDPTTKPVYDRLIEKVVPAMRDWKARHYALQDQRIRVTDKRTGRETTNEFLVEQQMQNLETMVNDVVPAYREAYPNEPLDVPLTQDRNKGKVNFKYENTPYLMDRYVYQGDTGALGVLRSRFRKDPWSAKADQMIERLEAARDAFVRNSGDTPPAAAPTPVTPTPPAPTAAPTAPITEAAQDARNAGTLTPDASPPGQLPQMPSNRPTFGEQPSNLLPVPPQGTAETLNLQPQVVGPRGQRQAEMLNGQLEFGSGPQTPDAPAVADEGADIAPTQATDAQVEQMIRNLPQSDIDWLEQRVKSGRIYENQGDTYRDNGLQKVQSGLDVNGNERYTYPYSPDLFVRSDASGAMMRNYITLPSGKRIHPDEIGRIRDARRSQQSVSEGRIPFDRNLEAERLEANNAILDTDPRLAADIRARDAAWKEKRRLERTRGGGDELRAADRTWREANERIRVIRKEITPGYVSNGTLYTPQSYQEKVRRDLGIDQPASAAAPTPAPAAAPTAPPPGQPGRWVELEDMRQAQPGDITRETGRYNRADLAILERWEPDVPATPDPAIAQAESVGPRTEPRSDQMQTLTTMEQTGLDEYRKAFSQSKVSAALRENDIPWDTIKGTVPTPDGGTLDTPLPAGLAAYFLDRAILRHGLDESRTLWRGVAGFTWADGSKVRAQAAALKPGDTYPHLGLMSTSMSEESARRFAGKSVLIEIRAPKGLPSIEVVNPVIDSAENEVLLPSTMSYRVVESRDIPYDAHRLVLEPIVESAPPVDVSLAKLDEQEGWIRQSRVIPEENKPTLYWVIDQERRRLRGEATDPAYLDLSPQAKHAKKGIHPQLDDFVSRGDISEEEAVSASLGITNDNEARLVAKRYLDIAENKRIDELKKQPIPDRLVPEIKEAIAKAKGTGNRQLVQNRSSEYFVYPDGKIERFYNSYGYRRTWEVSLPETTTPGGPSNANVATGSGLPLRSEDTGVGNGQAPGPGVASANRLASNAALDEARLGQAESLRDQASDIRESIIARGRVEPEAVAGATSLDAQADALEQAASPTVPGSIPVRRYKGGKWDDVPDGPHISISEPSASGRKGVLEGSVRLEGAQEGRNLLVAGSGPFKDGTYARPKRTDKVWSVIERQSGSTSLTQGYTPETRTTLASNLTYKEAEQRARQILTDDLAGQTPTSAVPNPAASQPSAPGTFSGNRAAPGGETGMNGEFYPGGTFLPNTTLPKRGVTAKPVNKGPKRQQIERGVWADRPEDMESIFARLVGQEAFESGGKLFPYEPYLDYLSGRGKDVSYIQPMIDRYNAGERWIPWVDAYGPNSPRTKMAAPSTPNAANLSRNADLPGEAVPTSVVDGDATAAQAEGFTPGRTVMVPVSDIELDPANFQPRSRRSQAIGVNEASVNDIVTNFDADQFEPITLWRRPDDGKLVLVSGHHRLTAAQRMGFDAMESRIVEGSLADAKRIGRRANSITQLKPTEYGRAIRAEMDEGASIVDAASTHKVKSSTAKRYVATTYLPENLQELVDDGTIGLAHGAVLGKAVEDGTLSPAAAQAFFQNRMSARSYTVEQLEDVVNGLRRAKTAAPITDAPPQDMFSALGMASPETDAMVSHLEDLGAEFRKADKLQKALKSLSGSDIADPADASRLATISERIAQIGEQLGKNLRSSNPGEGPNLAGLTFDAIDSVRSRWAARQAARGVEDAATIEARRVAEAGRFNSPAADTTYVYDPTVPGAEQGMRTERLVNQPPPPSTGQQALWGGNAPQVDPLMETLKQGGIDQETYDILNETVSFGGKWTKDETTGVRTLTGGEDMRLVDVYATNLKEGMTVKEAIDATMKALSPSTPPKEYTRLGSALRRFAGGITSFAREHLLYNALTGVRGILADQIGDSWTQLTSGNIEAAIKSYNVVGAYKVYRNIRDIQKGTVDAVVAGDFGQRLNRLGVADPTTNGFDVSGFTREGVEQGNEMAVHRFVEKYTHSHRLGTLTGALASEQLKDFRTAWDIFRRSNVANESIVKNLPKERSSFFDLVRTRSGFGDAEKLIASLGDEFSPRDVRRLGAEAGFNQGQAEYLARQWRSKVSNLDKTALADVTRVAFDYSPTNADEWLRKAFLFHTWQVRAAPLYLRNALRNPALAAAYGRMAQEMERQAEGEAPGTHGYLKLWSSGAGYAVFGNPVAMLSSALINLEPEAWDKPDATMLDKVLSRTPMMVTPVLQGIIYGLGYTSNGAPDLLMTNNFRNTLGGIIDYGRANGWAGASKTLGDNWYADLLNALGGAAYDYVGKYAPGNSKPNQIDSQSRDNELIQVGIRDLVYKKHGIAPGTTLETVPAAVRTEIYNTFSDWQTSTPNAIAEQAFREYSGLGGELGQRLTTLATPGGTRLRSETQDDLMVLRDQAFDAGRTDEGYALGNTVNVGRSGSPEMTRLTSQSEGYYALGTPEAQRANKTYNDIIHNPERVQMLTVSGQRYWPHELLQASEGERKVIATQWLSERGLTDDRTALIEQRDAYTSNPTNSEFAAYTDWRDLAYDYQGGNLRAFRENTAQGNPNYRAYIDGLSDEIKRNPAKFDQASVSQDAYLAYLGKKKSVYDSAPLPVRDSSQVPYSATQNTATGTGYQPQPKKDLATQLIEDAQEYQTSMIVFNEQLRQVVGNPNASLEGMNPQLRSAWVGKMTDIGLAPPSKPQSLERYERWAQVMAQIGKPNDVATYAAWIKSLEPTALEAGVDTKQLEGLVLSGNTEAIDRLVGANSGASNTYAQPLATGG